MEVSLCPNRFQDGKPTMINPEIIMTSFCGKNTVSPKGYSIFDNPVNEKKRLLFSENDQSGTGFLKLPLAPNFSVMRKSYSYEFESSSNDLFQERDTTDTSSSTTSVFAPQLSCFSGEGLAGSDECGDDNAQGKEDEKCGDGGDSNSKNITEDVHKRLQNQLALKQLEVQEIQQKIAKNKKWGDPRRLPSQDRHNNNKHTANKLPTVRSCPESLNQMSGLGCGQKEKNESYSGSNLDPNSPCFYPSHVTMSMSNPIWRPDGVRQQDIGCDGRNEQFQRGDAFNPFFPPINPRGQPHDIPVVCNNFLGNITTEQTYQFENGETSYGYGQMKRQFGAVGRPTSNQGYIGGKKSTNGQDGTYISCESNESWPNPPSMYVVEDDSSQIHENNFVPSAYTSVDPNKIVQDKFGQSNLHFSNDKARNFSHNSTNQKFQPPRNAFQIPKGMNFGAPRDGFVQKNTPAMNTFNPNRLRVVRKRQDVTKTWRQNDQQFKSPNMHCPSCKMDFKWPHVVSCLHSFCFSCIVKHFDQDLNQIKCPICSTVTELKEKSIMELDLDFTACKNLLQSKRMNPFSCMECTRDKYATQYCQECMKYICVDCQHDHETNNTTSGHKLHQVKNMTERQGNLFEVCPEHPDKILEQYCEDCKQLVCFQCTSFGERHNAHALGNMDKLYHSAVNKIRLMSNSMDEVRNEVQKRIQPLTILKQHIETSIRLCKQDIHKYSNSLLAETEKCRAKARLVIDKAHEDFTKDIEVAENLMTQYTSEYAPLTDFFRRYLFSANPQDFMTISPLIQKKILYMDEKHAEIQKHEGIFDTNVSFKANYSGINEYLQNQYNQILITENLSDALPSDSSEMGRRIEKDIIAAIERSSHHISPSGSVDIDLKASSGPSSPEDVDPQSEIFNYNRTGINFIHQFGNYGRGEYEFVEPSGVLYLLDGSLAVCDTANHRIMVYDNQFKYLRTIGQPPNLPPLRDRKEAESSRNDKHFSRTQSCLYFPYRIAQCPQTENIVVVERPPSRDIQIFTVLGQFITCFGSDILQHPRGVAVDEHGVIVTVEGRTMKLMLFSQEGQLLHRFFLSVHLEFPNDVAARDGLIYISDNRGHCVHVFDYNAEHKRTIGNESVTYYPIGVSLTHLNQVVVTDNHNTFNISVFNASPDGRYAFGFKSKVRHANCYNVAVHPHRFELAVTSRENQVVVFNFDPLRVTDDEKDKQPDQPEIRFLNNVQ